MSLSAAEWRRIEELFYQALDLPASEREAFLAAACEGDGRQLAELKRLLRAAEREEDKLAPAVRNAAAALLHPAAAPGSQMGPYRIERLLGQGGMGRVYLAVRADDQFQKRVAIKFLGGALASEEAIARFRQERQILASLSHPNIAHLLDGGATEEGLPYVVMEFVDGEPLDVYCRGRTAAEKIELMRAVCAAVGAAHRALIVHRDLKPGNVLVSPDGVCKLLDFGIAKLLESGPSLTRQHDLLFTPDYASPEQMRGEPAATSMDIYSLGAMLYALLAGRPPHQLQGLPPAEMERIVTGRRPGPLPGDIGLIAAKAMHPDAERRYQSCDELAADLERERTGYPVLARPDTLTYRARKFVARNALFTGAAAVTATALLAAGVSLYQARRAADEQYESVLAFSNSALFEFHDSIADLAGTTRARRLLAERAISYLDRMERPQASSERARANLAYGYEQLSKVQYRDRPGHLGDSAGALRSAGKALAIQRTLPVSPESRLRLASVLSQLGAVEMAAGQPGVAAAHLDEAIALGRRDAALADVLVEALQRRGELLHVTGDLAGAKAVLLDVMARRQQGKDPGDRYGMVEAGLVLAEIELQQFADGGRALEMLVPLEGIARELSERYPAVAGYRASVASVLNRQGHAWLKRKDAGQALACYTRSLGIVSELSRQDPDDARLRRSVAVHNTNVGLALARLQRGEEAEERFRDSLRMHEELQRSDPTNLSALNDVAFARTQLGRTLLARAQAALALEPLRRALAEREQLVARSPADTTYRYRLATARALYGDALRAQGACAPARGQYTEARALLASLGGQFDDGGEGRAIAGKLESPCR